MTDIAVLTRNYTEHLDPVLANGAPITFYSNVAWKFIEDAHLSGKSILVYFVVNEHPGEITYQGRLATIVIPPVKDTSLLNMLLDNAPDGAARAEVESGMARTVYSVTDIKRVLPSFSQTELLKHSDGKPVSKEYERSYCIVFPHE